MICSWAHVLWKRESMNIFMHPPVGTLTSLASRVVKDSTPSWRQILRYINFGIGEHSPYLFLDLMDLHVIISEVWWILNDRAFYCFIIFFISKWNLTYKKVSAWWIFTRLYFCGGESWPIYFGKAVNWW